MENQHLIKNLAENSATNSATAQIFKTVLSSAILATALSLSACGGGGGGGGGGSSSSPEKTSPPAGDETAPPAGDETAPAPQWSTPAALEDGSVTIRPVLMDGAGNKPMMLYGKNNKLYAREFDGTSWGTESLVVPGHNPQDDQLVWNINSNGKAIMARSRNATSATTGHNECYLQYYRYDGSNWGTYVNARILASSTSHYSCNNKVKDLDIALAGDNSMLMTWRRSDFTNSKYQYCDSSDECHSQPLNEPLSFGSGLRVAAIGLGSDSEGKVLILSDSGANGVFISEFDTEAGLGSATNIASPQGNNNIASMALNDTKHSLTVFNDSDDLKARFNNGSSWSQATTLHQQLRIDTLKLQTYLSDGADYGLTLYSNDNDELHTNLSDASSFAATSTQHQNGGELVARKFVGDINDNGKAVIAWVGYTYDPITDTTGRGTLYSRFYDGSNWLDTQTVDNDIDVSEFISTKGSLNVYLDNSDEVTLVYSAKKSTQSHNEAQLFYSRRGSSNTQNSQARLINSSKEEAEQIKAELEGAGAEVEVK